MNRAIVVTSTAFGASVHVEVIPRR
jgi:hypothetical protein